MNALTDLIALLVVLIAAAYVARALWRRLHPPSGASTSISAAAGCGTCNGCPAAAADTRACGATSAPAPASQPH
jgi:hypothetical protein